jgi:hypothetical protein
MLLELNVDDLFPGEYPLLSIRYGDMLADDEFSNTILLPSYSLELVFAVVFIVSEKTCVTVPS